MPVYQVPQFLDSGDKIIGPLGPRQLIYAMIGFFIAFLTYTIVSSIVPGLGVFAFVPALPIAGFTSFIAFGKYNGRDVEVYIMKFIVFMKKPKTLVYKRMPDLRELNERASKLTYESILSEWNKKVMQSQSRSSLKEEFDEQDAASKIAKIKKLTTNLDSTANDSFRDIYKKETTNLAKDKALSIEMKKEREKPKSDIPNYSRYHRRGPNNAIRTKTMQRQEKRSFNRPVA